MDINTEARRFDEPVNHRVELPMAGATEGLIIALNNLEASIDQLAQRLQPAMGGSIPEDPDSRTSKVYGESEIISFVQARIDHVERLTDGVDILTRRLEI